MTMSDPTVLIECDDPECDVSVEVELTALARGSFDTRNVESVLKSWGWRVEGDEHFCTDCKGAESDD